MKAILTVTLAASLLNAAAVEAGSPSLADREAELAKTADIQRGQTLYESRCIACHSLDSDRVGPHHRGVYGRRAGSVDGYAYSTAVKRSDVVWDVETLDAWLTNPQALIPGQKMNFRVAVPADRLDIIAYLKQESGG